MGLQKEACFPQMSEHVWRLAIGGIGVVIIFLKKKEDLS